MAIDCCAIDMVRNTGGRSEPCVTPINGCIHASPWVGITRIVLGTDLTPVYGYLSMMTSSNGTIFRVTGPLWGESTGHRWIPLTKARDAELRVFSFTCVWTNGWVNNRDACDLRRNRPHNDVTVMSSLIHCRCGSNLKGIIFKPIMQNSSLGICCEIAVTWLPQSPANEKVILVQVMAWCRKATSHSLPKLIFTVT